MMHVRWVCCVEQLAVEHTTAATASIIALDKRIVHDNRYHDLRTWTERREEQFPLRQTEMQQQQLKVL